MLVSFSAAPDSTLHPPHILRLEERRLESLRADFLERLGISIIER
jgi:hypothetical protein